MTMIVISIVSCTAFHFR